MAEGVGFEPTTPVSQGKRLAGARTRPLCDPSISLKLNTATKDGLALYILSFIPLTISRSLLL